MQYIWINIKTKSDDVTKLDKLNSKWNYIEFIYSREHFIYIILSILKSCLHMNLIQLLN